MASQETEGSGLRCTHCGVPFNEDSTFDDDGLCEKCHGLPRCRNHAGAIAAIKCPRCKGAFCAECLAPGANCAACEAKGLASVPPYGEARQPALKKGASGGKRGELTKRIPAAPAPKPAPRPKEAPRKRSASAGPQAPAPTASRGRAAIEARMRQDKTQRLWLWGTMLAVLVASLVLLGGFLAHANSPEARRARLTDNMALVQQAAIAFLEKNHRLPDTTDDIYQSLAAMDVSNARRIRLSITQTSEPETIIYLNQPPGFLIRATDSKGQYLTAADGQPLVLSQYEDTSRH